jgi:hypothetical protein
MEWFVRCNERCDSGVEDVREKEEEKKAEKEECGFQI